MKTERQLRKEFIEWFEPQLDVDKEMLRDCFNNYRTNEVNYDGKTCLDLGANIGGFAKIAIDNGAKKVVTIECDARNNKKILEKFLNEPKVDSYQAAVTNSNEPTIDIWKNDSKKSQCSISTIKRNGRYKAYDKVMNANIDKLLTNIKPDIIKVDIEGAEYDIIDSIIKYDPEFLFIELHTGKFKEKAKECIDILSKKYTKNEVTPIIVFGIVGAYDCWFKKG